ncbi:MAG: hypothetical protein Q8S55_14735 [Methylococcaceae bacterium]|nr:hypothetical protein [Methylococcaceae bacterium]
MQELYKPKAYPLAIRQAIMSQSSLGVAIANRWMLGWPKRVEKLLVENQYQTYFLSQVETERQALVEMTGMDHLAQHEKMAILEINPAPPMI